MNRYFHAWRPLTLYVYEVTCLFSFYLMIKNKLVCIVIQNNISKRENYSLTIERNNN